MEISTLVPQFRTIARGPYLLLGVLLRVSRVTKVFGESVTEGISGTG